MRILVTNDDGINSTGLHVLARAMKPFGEVVIAAPNTEYSGYGAALGTLHNMKPDVRRESVEGIDEAWSISAPPALCAMFGRLGVFGEIDLVVSGINPGANVGRAVYHSGTVGACLTARNGGISGVAVSQSVDAFGVEGQGWEEALGTQKWEGAAEVAAIAVGALVQDMPDEPLVLNINVPNRLAEDMVGWKRTDVGHAPPAVWPRRNSNRSPAQSTPSTWRWSGATRSRSPRPRTVVRSWPATPQSPGSADSRA